MRVSLRPAQGPRQVARVEGDHAVCAVCPSCEVEGARVRGTGIHTRAHDTYIAHARCLECDDVVGELECKVDTIFGIEEDERVLRHGRMRVY